MIERKNAFKVVLVVSDYTLRIQYIYALIALIVVTDVIHTQKLFCYRYFFTLFVECKNTHVPSVKSTLCDNQNSRGRN